MNVLICGDRHYAYPDRVWEIVRTFPADAVIIEGGAPGADTYARMAANRLGMTVQEFPVTPEEWKRRGKAAGSERNRRMLAEGKPDEVHGFHDSITSSKGTKHMLKISVQAGIPTFLHTGLRTYRLTEGVPVLAMTDILDFPVGRKP